MSIDRAKAVLRKSPAGTEIAYAVFLVDSWGGDDHAVAAEDSTFVEAFFDPEEAQRYAAGLKSHFRGHALPRIEEFIVVLDTDGSVMVLFPSSPYISVDPDPITASLGRTSSERTEFPILVNSLGKYRTRRMRFPLLVMVSRDDHVSASDVTEDLYCYNTTRSLMSLTTEADFFVTVDEETGAGISHGSRPEHVNLAPGEYAKVGDIKGWEWDSGMSFNVTVEIDDRSFHLEYNLKSTTGRAITLPGKEKGYVVRRDGRSIPVEEAE